MGRYRWSAWSTLVCMAAVGGAACVAGGKGGADPALEREARRYVIAFAENDRHTLRELSPRKLHNRFGPCLFADMPRLTKPRVDAHKAAVEFSGRTTDGDLPGRGIIVLVRLDERREEAWVVRGILWQGASSSGNAPDYSATAADRRQEPKALASSRKYLRAWLASDYQTMQRLTYDWVAHAGGDCLPVKVKTVEMRFVPLQGEQVKVRFTAHATVLGVIPRTIEGVFYGVQEDQRWKFRNHTMMF